MYFGDIFDDIIIKADSTSLLSEKTKQIAMTIKQYDEKLQAFLNEKEITKKEEEILLNIKENVSCLSDEVDRLKDDESFWSYLRNDNSIEEISSKINDLMNKIRDRLHDIGITDLTQFPLNNFYEDYKKIYNLYDKYINIFKKQRQELNLSLKRCTNLADDQLIDIEIDEEILQKYGGDMLDFVNFRKNDYPLNLSNDIFKYYRAFNENDNDSPVILLKLEDKKYFRRIIDVFKKMDHKYVEKYIGFCIENENSNPQYYIVTRSEGNDLESSLKREKKCEQLKAGDRTILAFKIAQAMSYIHSKNVIHRYLFSRSVYITRDTNGEIKPIIVGFRSSRVKPKDPNMFMTQGLEVNLDIIPQKFFAPEFDDNGKYDEKIDVFSFAGILYELLIGKPFLTAGHDEARIMIKEGIMPEIPEGTPEQLSKLIENCWNPDPTKRYSFDQILREMVEKDIYFKQDESKKDYIHSFYQDNFTVDSQADACIKAIEKIKMNIQNAYQYQNELTNTLPYLSSYQYFLSAEYQSPERINNETPKHDDDDDDTLNSESQTDNKEEEEYIKKLNDYINKLSAEVSKTLYERWIVMIMTQDFDASSISNKITEYMKKIHESITQLGYNERDEYHESREDLILDYFELRVACQTDKEHLDSEARTRIIRKINNFIKQKNLDFKTSDKIKQQRIVKSFSRFNQYNYDCNDFQKTFEVIKKQNGTTIYEGINKLNNEPVAIKVFSGQYIKKTPDLLYNIREEMEYMKKCDHKYIAKFVGYAIDQTKGACDVWIISELARSGNLQQKLNDASIPLTNDQKTIYALKIAQAMNYLHKNKILHLDVKPSHFFFNGEDPKLVDFSSACSDIKGITKHDSKSDIFAYCMMLMDMYKGSENPFRNVKKEELDESIKNYMETQFQSDVNNMNELEKLIFSGLRPESADHHRPTFKEIINILFTNQVMFPESNEAKIKEFYENEFKSFKDQQQF